MEDQDKEQLTKAMQSYRDIQDQITELTKKKNELRTVLMTLSKINDIGEYNYDDIRLRITNRTSKSMDKDKVLAFLAKHNEDESNYFIENQVEQLVVKRMRNKEEEVDHNE